MTDSTVFVAPKFYWPKQVGRWIIIPGPTNTSVAAYKKPNRFHIFMTELLLGWEWVDV
jgi:hypothetical protein